MDKHTDILYRLARFLAGVPPDTLGVVTLFVLCHPGLVAACLAVMVFLMKYVVGGLVSTLVIGYVVKMLAIHAWPKLPPNLRRLVRRAEEWALLKGVRRDRTAVRGADSASSKHKERHPHW